MEDGKGPVCEPHHDRTAFAISAFLCVGLVVSYLPQHYRIIANKSSEGFSAWFLLLGVVSSSSSLLNIVILQYDALSCCRWLSVADCFESLMGVLQIALQWVMFTLVFFLYMLYFPSHLKRIPVVTTTPPTPIAATVPIETASNELFNDLPRPNPFRIPIIPNDPSRSKEWTISLFIAATCLAHFIISVILTAILLAVKGSPTVSWESNLWAGILGVTSMLLAACQYLPQIWKTFWRKSVGALSIPMMLLQTPGSALFVYSLMTREGTNWTSWITYAATGALQGILLTMCCVFAWRNRKAGKNDFAVEEGGFGEERDRVGDVPRLRQSLGEREPLLGDQHQ
ncbi:hypothetical protein BZG36_02092 [Bifiguratus adelaidae]|uniref:PQ loop repeat protein n=1 Tax=Bifiguratus adelaidae TaxID=1938954 RepID=A0A261Y3A4_9FUNG|nr:hypothetical protein BZG36_02092 [Bifiguratus adelaidae]